MHSWDLRLYHLRDHLQYRDVRSVGDRSHWRLDGCDLRYLLECNVRDAESSYVQLMRLSTIVCLIGVEQLSRHAGHAQRDLMRALGWPKDAPEFVWLEVNTPRGKRSHPIVCPIRMFESLRSSNPRRFQKTIIGSRKAQKRKPKGRQPQKRNPKGRQLQRRKRQRRQLQKRQPQRRKPPVNYGQNICTTRSWCRKLRDSCHGPKGADSKRDSCPYPHQRANSL